MKQYAVIVAGGSGSRMGGGIPKQFRSLCGKPVLWWSMKAFHDENPATALILVLPQEFIDIWRDFFSSLAVAHQFEHQIAAGGASRSESVKNGLALVTEKESLVAVHDGARPLVTPEVIARGWRMAQEKGTAIPGVPLTDSIRHLKTNGSESVDRTEYVAVQTPQVFLSSLLKDCYEKKSGETFTDDAAVVENCGHHVSLYEGSHNNIKVTNPGDLEVAAVLMKKNA